MRTIVTLLATISFALALGACNTIKGAGQDIQRAGGAIEDAAKKK